MDKSSINLAKPKLEELSHEQLAQLLNEALDRLKTANERIEALEKQLNSSLPPKLPVPFSVRSAEDRKRRQKDLDKKNKGKNKPLRSGSLGPDQIARQDCKSETARGRLSCRCRS